jgi:signal transduction histidine kinase
MKRLLRPGAFVRGPETLQLPRWLRAILGIPLEMKLFGANLIVVTVAALLLFAPARSQTTALEDAYIAIAAMIVVAIVNFMLVRLALGPLGALERVANGVSGGRFGDRVPGSIVADHELARLSKTINDMLDALSENRVRMEQLAAEVVYAKEAERARVAGELHQSIGQTLATATFELDTLAFEIGNSKVSPRLAQVRQLLRSANDEIRSVSQSLHPRKAADLVSTTSADDLGEPGHLGGSPFDRRGLPTRHDLEYLELGSRGGRQQ